MSTLLAPPAKSLTPPPMRPVVVSSPPKPMRFTIEQYRDLNRTGLFHDVKTMLLDGELYVMGMPYPPHDVGILKMNRWLQRVFGEGYVVRAQLGFDIGTANDPGPDFAVVVGDIDGQLKATPTKAELVIEIADSSLAIDTVKKALLYATAAVPDYWVLDVDGRQLHVFRDPQPGGTYGTHKLLNETDSIAPLAAPTAIVTVAELLPSAAA